MKTAPSATIYPTTFRSLMAGHATANIHNLFNGEVVRKLTRIGDNVEIDAMTEKVTVPLNTDITYQPWFMDRGSLLFECAGYKGGAKICTEYDVIEYPDGSRYSIGGKQLPDESV